jgi:23S rRNA pseudouridine955/2504/2580 synthase
MFLHAFRTRVSHPETGEVLQFEAQLPDELQKFLDYLKQHHAQTV